MSNLSLLEEENSSLNNSMRIGIDIENQARTLNTELSDQKSYLDKISEKVNKIYSKLQISNSITHFLIRRGRGDTYLCLFLGMLTLVIIFYVYYYIRPKVRGV
jgi:hypothetical protein